VNAKNSFAVNTKGYPYTAMRHLQPYRACLVRTATSVFSSLATHWNLQTLLVFAADKSSILNISTINRLTLTYFSKRDYFFLDWCTISIILSTTDGSESCSMPLARVPHHERVTIIFAQQPP
jgi:hypothetical protein